MKRKFFVIRMKSVIKGGTSVRVYHPENGVGFSIVSDHDSWYYRVKEKGVTHWYNG